MFEHLKTLLEMLEGVAGIGLWVLVGYILYMLVIYLSTTGAIVFCVRLLVESIRDAHKRSVDAKETIEREKLENERRPKEWSIDGIVIDEETKARLTRLLDNARDHINRGSTYRHKYLHNSDIEWLEKAVAAYKDKD